jgi:hypothetical protein
MADEELISSELIAKYLAKSKAPKTQVTPVRKQDADFRVTPSLTGPATVKRKLGDNEGYPRGFNPEQMREVRGAEESGDLILQSTAKSGKSRFLRRPLEPDPVRAHPEHEKARVREMLARSGVQPSVQFKPHRFSDSPTALPITITVGEKNLEGAPAGVYKHHDSATGARTRAVDIQYPHLFPERAAEHQKVVQPDAFIHEIGHDADQIKAVTERVTTPLQNAYAQAEHTALQVNALATPIATQLALHKKALKAKENLLAGYSGHSEGFADEFARKNFVDDPRDVRKKAPWVYKPGSTLYSAEAAVGLGRYDDSGGKTDPLTTWSRGYEHSGAPIAEPGSSSLEWLAEGANALPEGLGISAAGATNAMQNVTGQHVLMAKPEILKANTPKDNTP